jgi:hypothetical protein
MKSIIAAVSIVLLASTSALACDETQTTGGEITTQSGEVNQQSVTPQGVATSSCESCSPDRAWAQGGLYFNVEHDFTKWFTGGVHTEWIASGQRGVDAKGEGKILLGGTLKI